MSEAASSQLSTPLSTAAGYTGIGSVPGEDIESAIAAVLDESPRLAYLPELPARGPGSDMIGRTLAAITSAVGDFGFDLQPSGWRLTARPGLDAARGAARLSEDIDGLIPYADFDAALKTQLMGPWTLAAQVELPRGGRALGDRGATRDIVAALEATAADHLSAVGTRVPRATLVLQLDEPSLPRVVEGSIATESGFGRIAAVPAQEVVDSLARVVAGARFPTAIHCCGHHPPLQLLADAGAAAVSFDASRLVTGESIDEDLIGGLVERDVQLWLGVVPSLGPGVPPTPRSVADPVRRLWRALGFGPERLAASVVLTPTCGLAGASAGWARESMRVLRQAARALSEGPDILRS